MVKAGVDGEEEECETNRFGRAVDVVGESGDLTGCVISVPDLRTISAKSAAYVQPNSQR